MKIKRKTLRKLEKEVSDGLNAHWKHDCNTILQFFSFTLAQFSNKNYIFQNNKLKSLNNSMSVNNRNVSFIQANRTCFGTCVQRISLIVYNLYNNHLHMACWSKLMTWFSVKLSSSSQLLNILSSFEPSYANWSIWLSKSVRHIFHKYLWHDVTYCEEEQLVFFLLNYCKFFHCCSVANFLFTVYDFTWKLKGEFPALLHKYIYCTHMDISYSCVLQYCTVFPSKLWPTVEWESKQLRGIHNSIQLEKTDILV